MDNKSRNDQNSQGRPNDPSTGDGATGIEGGYGGDTGFASDQAQGVSGQVSGEGGRDESLDEGEDPSAASASDTRAGSDTGGSRSGAQPRSNPDDRLRDERHEASPAGTASMVPADVMEDLNESLAVQGEDGSEQAPGESRTFAGGGGEGTLGGRGGSGIQSGGHMTQPGTMVKQTATDLGEDSGHLDRGESHMGNDRDPEQSGRGPASNHQKGAF